LKRGTRFFYVMGGLILVLTVWLGIEAPWNQLSDEIAFLMLLDLIMGLSVGFTEIAVGWLVGVHIEEE
jgi:uncharacterized membrane protein